MLNKRLIPLGVRRFLFGSCYKLNFGALIKQSNSHKRAVLDYLRKVHFKPLVNL